MWATATDLARDRNGFEPLNAEANGVFEQTEILPRADAAAMGSPCQVRTATMADGGRGDARSGRKMASSGQWRR